MGGRAGHAAVRKLRKNKLLKSLTPRSPGRDKRLATQSVLRKACALVHIWSRHVFFAWILCSRWVLTAGSGVAGVVREVTIGLIAYRAQGRSASGPAARSLEPEAVPGQGRF